MGEKLLCMCQTGARLNGSKEGSPEGKRMFSPRRIDPRQVHKVRAFAVLGRWHVLRSPWGMRHANYTSFSNLAMGFLYNLSASAQN